MPNELRRGPWKLTDLANVEPNGLTVFSCFHGGGGSTMGYKLAGYNVLGGVELDPKMMEIYRINHKPRLSYLMSVSDFCRIPDSDLPQELFNLNILDGSPPCSTFSMAGSREKKWGKKTKFREGQAEQILDDCFFDFIALAKKLKPQVVVAENVKGLISGNARGYVKLILRAFKDAGYECQLFLLNAAAMGVPQRRERLFIFANKQKNKNLYFDFKENISTVKSVMVENEYSKQLSTHDFKYWLNSGKNGRGKARKSTFGFVFKVNPNEACATIDSNSRFCHWNVPNLISEQLIARIQSFPDDYNFMSDTQYVCGMSVPPFMMQRIADQIARQWFAK